MLYVCSDLVFVCFLYPLYRYLLQATITLLADNVIQAEVAIKHAKTPGGVYRAVAQPDVQWKLQQLQVCFGFICVEFES